MSDGSTGRRIRWQAVGLLALAFAAGAVAGGAVVAAANREEAPHRAASGQEAYLDRLASEVGLTAVQRDSVRAVLDRYAPRFDSLLDPIRSSYETLRQSARAEI